MSLGLRAVFKLISLPVLPLRADPRKRTWLEELLKTIYKSHCERLQIQFYDYVLSPTLQRIGGRDRERQEDYLIHPHLKSPLLGGRGDCDFQPSLGYS